MGKGVAKQKQKAAGSGSPELLRKIAKGKKVRLDRKGIFEYNKPNYLYEDILLDEMTMDINPYDHEKGYNLVHCTGRCVNFPEAVAYGGSFPELRWEHVNATLLSVIITQAGRTSHNVCSEGRNGVALRYMEMIFRRPATIDNVVTFEYDSEIYERHSEVWADSRWKFYSDGKKFADFNITSRGIFRDYSGVEENMKTKQEKYVPLGEKMILKKVITPWQRDFLLEQQKKLKNLETDILFGELAIEKGFCTEKQLKEFVKPKGRKK